MFGEFFVQSGTEGNEEEQELGDEVGQYIYSLKKKRKRAKAAVAREHLGVYKL